MEMIVLDQFFFTDEEEFHELGSYGEQSKSEEDCEVDDSVKNIVQKDFVLTRMLFERIGGLERRFLQILNL